MSPLPINLVVTLVVTVALILAVFAVADRRGRYDLIDSVWGLGFAVVAVLSFALSSVSGGGDLLVRALLAGLTVVWGVRLAGHIHARNRKAPEDRRYAEILRRAGDHPRRYVLTRVYLMQAGMLWFISLPVQFAAYGSTDVRWLVWVGVVVWALGFGFEAVGDHQLRVFRADPGNAGRVLDRGLWRYTRHPNYFGDACVWWGLYLIAASTGLGAVTILAPLVMTWLLAKGTGKPLLEKDIADRRPDYAEYVARTSGFVPLPPRPAAR